MDRVEAALRRRVADEIGDYLRRCTEEGRRPPDETDQRQMARAIVRRFLGRGLRLGLIGAASGTVVALGATRLLGSVLFGVSATDPVSFARAAAIVLGTVAAATMLPAWRASRTDPVKALRHQ